MSFITGFYSDCHYIDDPLYVINHPLDYSNIGMKPISKADILIAHDYDTRD